MAALAWEIPVGLFFALSMLRLIMAPYWLYKDRHLFASKAEGELHEELTRIQTRAREESDHLNSQIEQLRNKKPALELQIIEAIVDPNQDDVADCFLRVFVHNLTPGTRTTIHEFRLILEIGGKQFSSNKPLPIAGYATGHWEWDDDENPHYELKVADEELEDEENLGVTLKNDPLVEGVHRQGWLYFRVNRLPHWPTTQVSTFEVTSWQDEEGEWHDEQGTVTKLLATTVERVELQMFDVYSVPHADKKDKPFSGKTILRPAERKKK
jgi:hypothetical protein